jgi:hypothetical protein
MCAASFCNFNQLFLGDALKGDCLPVPEVPGVAGYEGGEGLQVHVQLDKGHHWLH